MRNVSCQAGSAILRDCKPEDEQRGAFYEDEMVVEGDTSSCGVLKLWASRMSRWNLFPDPLRLRILAFLRFHRPGKLTILQLPLVS